MGGVGGIAGGLVFRTQDAPHYRPGIYACLATSALSCVLVGILSIISIRQNKRADRGEVELEYTEGDQKGFRYTI